MMNCKICSYNGNPCDDKECLTERCKKMKSAEILECHIGSDYYQLRDLGFSPHIITAMEEYKNQELKKEIQLLRDKIADELGNSEFEMRSIALEILDSYINNPVKKDI